MTKKISEDYKERMADPTLTWYEKLYGRSEHDVKRALLRVVRDRGVHRIEAQYSGGHDEGGVQDMQAWDRAGNEVEIEGWDDPLWQACDDVLSTKFFSWALGFSVEGKLIVDLEEKRAWTEGQYEDWVPDEEPLDWRL